MPKGMVPKVPKVPNTQNAPNPSTLEAQFDDEFSVCGHPRQKMPYGMNHHRSTATIRESRKLKGTHFGNHESAGAEKGADLEPAMRFGLNLRDQYWREFPICSSSRESNPFFSLDL